MDSEMLLEELHKERKNIKTDSYSMSIGELINLYKDGELKLNPAFQRLYRWNDGQKTDFIESILIGIPIPEIFVAQKEDGKWDIVDGVQRISTLLQLTGELKYKEPLVLKQTQYLPSIEGYTWETLPLEVKRILRRAKIGVNIILTENSIQSQYELFKRLNTGGLHLEDQEIRNCLLIMVDEDFYNLINELKEYHNFKKCLKINPDKFDKEYHMELIIRYFIARFNIINYDDYNISQDKISVFLDKEIIRIIESGQFNRDNEVAVFKKTFDYLSETLGENSFKKYHSDKCNFEGPFSTVSYDLIVSGLSKNIEKISQKTKEEFKECVEKVYEDERYIKASKSGVKAINRFKELSTLSQDYFTNEV